MSMMRVKEFLTPVELLLMIHNETNGTETNGSQTGMALMQSIVSSIMQGLNSKKYRGILPIRAWLHAGTFSRDGDAGMGLDLLERDECLRRFDC